MENKLEVVNKCISKTGNSIEKNNEDFKYIPYKVGFETRWKIIDKNGKVIDDAQGYGYKSKQNAIKAIWYRENKNKFPKRTKRAKQIIKENEILFKQCCWILKDIDIIKEGDNPSTVFWKAIQSENNELYQSLTKKEKNDIERILMENGK